MGLFGFAAFKTGDIVKDISLFLSSQGQTGQILMSLTI